MRILITTPIFPPDVGGPATYTYESAKRLSSKGHKIKVVTFLDSNKKEIEGVEIFTVKTRRNSLLRQGIMFAKILWALREMDLLFAQDPVVVGFSSFLASKALSKPIILRFVGSISWETAFRFRETSKFFEEFLKSQDGRLYTRVLLKLEKFILSNVNKIVTPSFYLKDVLVKHYDLNPQKIVVIPNAIDLQSEELSPKMRYGDPMIVTVGRLVPWKGIQEIIEVLPYLIRKYTNLVFLIVGDGPERDNLKKKVGTLGLRRHVVFLGALPREEVFHILKSADVFILNSRYEGLPHVVIEAMASKVPVVASNIKPNRELIENNVNGLLIDIGSKEQLVNAIMSLLENQNMRRRISDEAYRTVENHFTWEKTLGNLERVFEETLYGSNDKRRAV